MSGNDHQARAARQLLTAQADHAALGASIMRACRADGLPDSAWRADILLAVEQHDNGRRVREVDAAPIVGAGGRVLNVIKAPDDVCRGVWYRLLRDSNSKLRWHPREGYGSVTVERISAAHLMASCRSCWCAS